MRVLIGIPVYINNELHLEFTQKTVESIKTVHHHDILLLSNHCLPEYWEELSKLGLAVKGRGENSVTGAWNQIIERGIAGKYDYIMIINNDLIFRKDSIDNLIRFAEKSDKKGILWSSAEYTDPRTINSMVPPGGSDEHPHFSCFMVSPRTIELLKEKETGTKEPNPGMFDESYSPAYFEDGDMHNRIIRAGYKAFKTGDSIFYHFGSRTIKTDRKLEIENMRTYEKNRAYFKEKWGFDPHGKVVENDDPIRFLYKGPFEPK